MSVKCGIVGLPNVGKSTLFNALTNKNVAAENFPFCTIDPNIGIAPINDIRLKKIANIVNSKKIIKTFIEFIDIAGLIQGSYKGEGLGNKFLNNIQNTDAVIHVVRAFNDTNIAHIYDNVQPISDIEIINMELILFDLNICESRILTIEKKIKTQDSLLKKEILVLQNCISYLKKFIMLRTLDLDASEKLLINHLRLLTLKPMMYVVNVNNKVHHNISSLEPIYELAKKEHTKVITLCAKNEKEQSSFKNIEINNDIKLINIHETELDHIIYSSYSLLNLHTFFTAGVKEVKAWTISKNSTALEAAGVIHTDFKKGFIRAQIISYMDFIKYQGEKKAKEYGKMKIEGKNYIVQDGDIINFLFNI